MTAYEQGFITKCAEYGVDGRRLLKQARYGFNENLAGIGLGALGGGVIGALSDRKHRLRNAIIGTLLGAGAGYGVSAYTKPRPGHAALAASEDPGVSRRTRGDTGTNVPERKLPRLVAAPRRSSSEAAAGWLGADPSTLTDDQKRQAASEASSFVDAVADAPAVTESAPVKPTASAVTNAPAAAASAPVKPTAKAAPAPETEQAAAPEKPYVPPDYVGYDSETGKVIRIPKFDYDAYMKRLSEIQPRYGLTASGGRTWYRDDNGVKHDILKEEFGVPEGFVVSPLADAVKRSREHIAPILQQTSDMGRRYKLRNYLQTFIKDKERAESAVSEFAKQYTPFGGRVTPDTELIAALYKAISENPDDTALKAALTQIASEYMSYGTGEGTPQYRARPVTIDLSDLSGSAERAMAGRPDVSVFQDRELIKRILNLLNE